LSSNGKGNPPVVAWFVAENLRWSSSEYYRCNLPCGLLVHKRSIWGNIAWRFSIPEKPGPIVCDPLIPGKLLAPHLVVMRPFHAVKDADPGTDPDMLAKGVRYAQDAGQIVICDMDDDPWGWVAEHPEAKQNWEDAFNWMKECNAISVSTRFLGELVAKHFDDMPVFHFPNLYDAYRYERHVPEFRKVIGCHIGCSTRVEGDIELLGGIVERLFSYDPEIVFEHLGERAPCRVCGHQVLMHRNLGNLAGERPPCIECRNDDLCSGYEPPDEGYVGELARATGLPENRIRARSSCSLEHLPDQLGWAVGIVPLVDCETNYAKTDLKGVEMAAAGIPFFAATGAHPLYRSSPGWGEAEEGPYAILSMLNASEENYRRMSDHFRRWAHLRAQEAEVQFLTSWDRLARSDLRRRRNKLLV
jgi:hypothetical protein